MQPACAIRVLSLYGAARNVARLAMFSQLQFTNAGAGRDHVHAMASRESQLTHV